MHELTATERVRELLDELRKLACDINEEEIRSHSVITLNQGRYNRQFRLDMNHDWLNAWHAELERILQTIAATLGESPRLPYWWTHDGTLHIELPKLPESISVRLPDQRDREVGSARTWQYMRDSGTCKVDVLNTGDCAGYECSEYIMHCNGCGHEFGHVLYNEDGDVWMSEKPRYCPNCGRRIEVDE